ncbi:MAG: galactokinase, partial [Eubacterium sp.]|nr:galactokinase [Eubacterium sp.]
CGLMDQAASSVGGIIAIDLKDPENPQVDRIDFAFEEHGYVLCILDSGAGHADLTGEYAAVTGELKAVCRYFGEEFLRDVPYNRFVSELPQVRKTAGDRAVLRAMHVYADDKRAVEQAKALRKGRMEDFLGLVRDSGISSALYLQNIIPLGQTSDQSLMLTLALAESILQGRGAVRVHGGGFGGTAQAYVPLEMFPAFKEKMEAVLGAGSCHKVSICPLGGARIR